MPTIDIFGNEILSAEEVKEKKRKEAEAEKAKEAERQRKAAEEAQRKSLEAFKEEHISKLEEIVNSTDIQELKAECMAAQTQMKNAEDIVSANKIFEPFIKNYAAIASTKKEQEEAKKKAQEEANQKKYKYPFIMYFGHQYRDVTGFFEDGKEYTEKQITKILVEHGFKEFKVASIEYEYFEDENCLFPKFKLGNRG